MKKVYAQSKRAKKILRVNEAVERGLTEDHLDLAAFKERAHEQHLRFESILKDLRSRGKL